MSATDIIYAGISSIITLLLGANIFFIKGFFSRMEKSVCSLVTALEESKDVIATLSSKLTLLDYQVSELNRIVKNGADEDRLSS